MGASSRSIAEDDAVNGRDPEGDDTGGGIRRPSPPTDRVVAIINLLVSEPEREHSLTEIIDALGISRATCYAIVRALLDAGFVARAPDAKGYTLGPALVAAGRAAERSFPAVRAARPLLPAIARRFGAECTAAVIDGDFIDVVEWSGPTDRPASGRVGQRIPLVPPFGAVQMAWAAPEVVARWIARSRDGSPAWRAQLDGVLATIRARRFDAHQEDDASARFRGALAALAHDELSDGQRRAVDLLATELVQVTHLPAVLDPEREYHVNVISSAAFDHDARPTLTLSLLIERAMVGAEVERAGQALVDLAAEVTAATGGRLPAPDRA